MHKIHRAILIDDEQFDQMAYRRLMSGMAEVGDIMSFQYADDALDFFRQSAPQNGDVIFLDINMPRMNGFEFLDAATKEFGDEFNASVIVMLTTSLTPSDTSRACRYDAIKSFVNKPLTQSHIRDACELVGRPH